MRERLPPLPPIIGKRIREFDAATRTHAAFLASGALGDVAKRLAHRRLLVLTKAIRQALADAAGECSVPIVRK